jgi:hypothetical protein
MSGEVNVVALVRGDEQYIFMFDESNRTETLRMLGRYAADPELSFTWYDAAVMSQKVREMATSKKAVAKPSHVNANLLDADDSPHEIQKPPRFKMPGDY